jgi:2-dehydro-3-deoxyphosphooctonate aldolase (KDO 8-P synthase)
MLESREHAKKMTELILESLPNRPIDFYFKASFDKANRSSIRSTRGIGIDAGSDVLQEIREEYKIKTTTDVHECWQCSIISQSVNCIQIPAFLCRQTDLLLAAAGTGCSVNIKKGQFLAPWDMRNVVDKIKNVDVWITERGTSFGYNTLVVDYRGLPIMRSWGHPVIFDATHSVQQPGGLGDSSGGQREFVEALAKAAVAVGIDGLFIETHDDPDNAPSDGPNQIPVHQLRSLLERLVQ